MYIPWQQQEVHCLTVTARLNLAVVFERQQALKTDTHSKESRGYTSTEDASSAGAKACPWDVGQFGRRLVETSTMYKNRTVLRGSEAYMSKQCGACGSINDRLGSSITFVCPNCSSVLDRDVHATRNMLLRFMEWVGDGSLTRVKQSHRSSQIKSGPDGKLCKFVCYCRLEINGIIVRILSVFYLYCI